MVRHTPFSNQQISSQGGNVMYRLFALVMLAAVKSLTAEPTIRDTADLDPHSWTLPDGTEAFKITITIKMQYFVPNGWRMALIFTQPIKRLEVWRAKVHKDICR